MKIIIKEEKKSKIRFLKILHFAVHSKVDGHILFTYTGVLRRNVSKRKR